MQYKREGLEPLSTFHRGVACRFDNANEQCVKLCFREITERCNKTTMRIVRTIANKGYLFRNIRVVMTRERLLAGFRTNNSSSC